MNIQESVKHVREALSYLQGLVGHPNLIGSRWIMNTARYERHVIEVIEVRGEKAHVATVYSNPFKHWWVPLNLLSEDNPMVQRIGCAKDFEWVRRGAWVMRVQDTGLTQPDIWRIDQVGLGATVFMFNRLGRRSDGTIYPEGSNCSIETLRVKYRPLTDEEIEQGRDIYGVGLPDPAPLGTGMPYFQDAPAPAVQEPPPQSTSDPGPSQWERLNQEDK